MAKKKSGRNFQAALRPAWSEEEIKNFCNKMLGDADIYAITHDRDFNDKGEIVSPHTHILIEYRTPRYLSTVANVLGVAENFVEITRNKVAARRYLLHANNPEKAQYKAEQVISNNKIDFGELVAAAELSNSEIIEILLSDGAVTLVDLVEPNRLRSLQAIVQFDKSDSIQRELRMIKQYNKELSYKLDSTNSSLNELLDSNKKFIETMENALSKVEQVMTKAVPALFSEFVSLTRMSVEEQKKANYIAVKNIEKDKS